LRQSLDTGTGCSEDLGMAFAADGSLYATASFGSCSGKVVKFDNKGNLKGPFGSGYSSSTESIAVDKNGNVFVGQPDGTREVLEFDKNGNPVKQFTPAVGSRGTDWIDLASDNCTLYYTSEGSDIRRFNVCTNTQLAAFASGLPGPCYALRIRPNGEVMVACSNSVVRLSKTGTVVKTYPKDGSESSFLFALNLDPDNATFWTAAYSTANVYRYDIATGAKVKSFAATKVGCCLSGLAVAGEIRVAEATTTTTRSTTTTTVATLPVTAQSLPTTTTTVAVQPAAELPRTGSHSAQTGLVGFALVALGGLCTFAASSRRRRLVRP
jgi:sugar lactone lactonase YvrE